MCSLQRWAHPRHSTTQATHLESQSIEWMSQITPAVPRSFRQATTTEIVNLLNPRLAESDAHTLGQLYAVFRLQGWDVVFIIPAFMSLLSMRRKGTYLQPAFGYRANAACTGA